MIGLRYLIFGGGRRVPGFSDWRRRWGGSLRRRTFAVMVTGLVGWGSVSLYRSIQCAENVDQPDGYFAQGGEAWVWVLLYAQPLFLMNSFTVMTEMLLACAWVWAMVLLLRGPMKWAGLVLGLGAFAPRGVAGDCGVACIFVDVAARRKRQIETCRHGAVDRMEHRPDGAHGGSRAFSRTTTGDG